MRTIFQDEHERVMNKLYMVWMIICNKIYLCRLVEQSRTQRFKSHDFWMPKILSNVLPTAFLVETNIFVGVR
ncbi:hypothetical protein DP117_30620 [Brasilonema sp. UFV-L1]|nr:hypothetical protein [Brasilonema sp. UFV-L1]